MSKTKNIPYHHLFRPIDIRSMVLRNRILMLPMHIRLDPSTEQARAFYAARAKGGVGAIVSWATVVDLVFSDKAWGEPGAASAFMESLSPLIQQVHEGGAKIGMQLAHFSAYPPQAALSTNWLRTFNRQDEVEWVAPSARIEPTPAIHGGTPPGLPLRELTIQEIETIIDKYSRAAAEVKKAKFDFLELHFTHGTLPCQFFSPRDNHRTDKFGGDLTGRMRFGLDCVTGIRDSVGDDYPIFFRIAAQDFDYEGGITLADSISYARELERAGVDCFSVSFGVSGSLPYFENISPGPKMSTGTFAPFAAAIKQEVQVPVIAGGKINTPEVAEDILSQGKADIIGIGRQLITDPLWPKKVMEGRVADIIACASCNRNCWAGTETDLPLEESLCKTNPEAGSSV